MFEANNADIGRGGLIGISLVVEENVWLAIWRNEKSRGKHK